jgi:LmbE family N-acetylglucosaminyl deacetylase
VGGESGGARAADGRRRHRRQRRAAGIGVAVALSLALVIAGRSSAAPDSCPAGAVLNVIAHPDDDLLFFGPDLMHEVDDGACVRTVVVTAGDAGSDVGWRSRENGLMAAYASIAGVAGHPMPLQVLDGNPRVSIVFMRLPDGFPYGGGSGFGGYQSLEKLWDGSIGQMDAIDGSSSYGRAGLIDALTALMADLGPDQIHGMDHLHAGDGDHSDHYASADFAHAAHLQYQGGHVFTGYQGYGISSRPPNLSPDDVARKRDAFLTYAPYDSAVCQNEGACIATGYADWWERRYTVGSEAGGGGTTTTSATTSSTAPSSTTTVPGGTSVNVAPTATATASSQNTSTGQTANKAIDGSTSGYPADPTREWATVGGRAGSWLQLTWTTPQTLSRIVLYDRPNTTDRITAATLTFSDGSIVTVGALNNSGAATTVTFPARATTSVRLTITAVSRATRNIGLAEIQTWTAV